MAGGHGDGEVKWRRKWCQYCQYHVRNVIENISIAPILSISFLDVVPSDWIHFYDRLSAQLNAQKPIKKKSSTSRPIPSPGFYKSKLCLQTLLSWWQLKPKTGFLWNIFSLYYYHWGLAPVSPSPIVKGRRETGRSQIRTQQSQQNISTFQKSRSPLDPWTPTCRSSGWRRRRSTPRRTSWRRTGWCWTLEHPTLHF